MSSPHCELCRKSFKTLFALQNHEKDSPAHMTHHCEQCQKSFQSQAALSQHTKTSRRHKTGRQVPPSQQTTEVKVQPTKAIRQSLPKTAVPKSGSSQAVIYAERCLQPKAPKLKELKSTTTGALNVAKSVTTNSPGPLSPWAVIPKFSYTTVFNTLSEHCHSPEDLKSNGFILDLYDPLTSIFKPGKCRNCNGKPERVSTSECTFHPKKRKKKANPDKTFKCCGKVDGGCQTSPTHDFKPPVVATYHPESLQTPSHIAENPKRLAVVLDCEMAGTSGGSDEAIYICAADYLTGEILINGFVNPNTRIIQMRASIHGISKATLEDAVAEGKALSGWEGARSELWKYIDDHTILVGHSLEHDLNVLRLIHPRIVDAGILAKNAVGLHHRWGLQRLCSEFLILEIRRNKGRVHDCLEDVLATREVVLMSTREKEAFQYWAEAKRKEKKQVKKNGQARIRRKRKDKQTKEAVQNTTNATSQHTTDEETGDNNDCEYMRWEDVAEDMGYPHPDTGYDPWSD